MPLQEDDKMLTERPGLVLIGLGANLPTRHGSPRQTLEAALQRMTADGLVVTLRSSMWRSRPVPISDQPWFVNAVAAIDTDLAPGALLDRLHRIEADFGRVRTVVNAPRVLDLDLLAYGDTVLDVAPGPLVPHPRMAGRAFVLHPLQEIAPRWIHPVTGLGLEEMIKALPADQICEKDV